MILGLGHGFLRQFGALFLSHRGVEHGLEKQRDIRRDGRRSYKQPNQIRAEQKALETEAATGFKMAT